MSTQIRSSSRITPMARVAYRCAAIFVICLAVRLDLRHPLQLTMDILAPIPPLLLAATNSYRSVAARLALSVALLLIVVMLAQPLLQPKPWRF
jgi:hypothetical protein